MKMHSNNKEVTMKYGKYSSFLMLNEVKLSSPLQNCIRLVPERMCHLAPDI